MSMVKN